MDFFRFPHTPHLVWLADGRPRDDKLLAPDEADDFLCHRIIVEEKVDGANIGFSLDEELNLCFQNRGALLSRDWCPAQFKPLFRWIQRCRDALMDALLPDLTLFGEWCYAVHSIMYVRLPDWFLGFDVFDRARNEFWEVARRNRFLHELGLTPVPFLGEGYFSLADLKSMLGRSRIGDMPAEGLYLRWEENGKLKGRAKIVRPEFVQDIDEHWSRRKLETNCLEGKASW